MDKLSNSPTTKTFLDPKIILETCYQEASKALENTFLSDSNIDSYIDTIVSCRSNRSGIRLVMSCLLAKVHLSDINPIKPYTEIGTSDSFSGRTYDEKYIGPFVYKHHLPVNSTTAFLTPTLRNINQPLSTEYQLIGRPRELYQSAQLLLNSVAKGSIDAELILIEIIRLLIVQRDEKSFRLKSLLKGLASNEQALPLSSENIVNLLQQHLSCPHASRLPVLMIAAIYQTVGQSLTEQALPLKAHNAADRQTGALGDLEICLMNEQDIVTVYEMKLKAVTVHDIDTAITKISTTSKRIDNYLFVTTDIIDKNVIDYAKSFYEKTQGTEIVILDCIACVRHFLHLFHRIRQKYLESYQDLVLQEPDSSVNHALKEAFLALRQAAETSILEF